MKNADFFVAILHRLRDYEAAVLLAHLVALEAETVPVRASTPKLAAALGLNHRQVHRAAQRLESVGLLQTRVHPKTWTEYTVREDALCSLLEQPIADTPHMPGVSQRDIPFVSRWLARSPGYGDSPPVTPTHSKEEV